MMYAGNNCTTAPPPIANGGYSTCTIPAKSGVSCGATCVNGNYVSTATRLAATCDGGVWTVNGACLSRSEYRLRGNSLLTANNTHSHGSSQLCGTQQGVHHGWWLLPSVVDTQHVAPSVSKCLDLDQLLGVETQLRQQCCYAGPDRTLLALDQNHPNDSQAPNALIHAWPTSSFKRP